jgi:glycosyltransferase involved in cell wall biosynthesis
LAVVCALNNYSLEKMRERARSGAMPAQHVWGVDALAARGHVVQFAPFHEASDGNRLERLSLHTRGLLGHLDQEAYATRRIRRLDALYCADQMGLSGLAMIRSVLPHARLISVVHHPVGHAARRAALARHDALVCLSPAIQAELERALSPRRARPKLIHLPWGPDLASPLYRAAGEANGVVSVGKSNRDLPTLAEALAKTGASGVVYDLERRLTQPPSDAVRVVHPGQSAGVDPNSPGGYLPARAIAETAAASIVAIPVLDPARLTGLTEAVDALALAKPIVATRSPYFPFDIEALGCGVWVDPGDVGGWVSALARLAGDPDARAEMGAAGRRFAEREWNYDAFSRGLSELIEE